MAKSRLTLRAQINSIVGITTAGALLAAAAVLSWGEQARYAAQVQAMLQAEAELVGSNSSPALEFDDSTAGAQILRSLQATPEVVAAVLRKSDGSEFARYSRLAGADASTAALGEIGTDTDVLRVTRPVMGATGEVGSIEILADRSLLYQGLWQRLQQVAMISVVAMLAALWVASRGASRVIRPVTELLAVAARITKHKDYSLRADVEASGEIQDFITGFNSMLAEIETRDLALRGAKAKVESTSRELADASRRAGMAEVAAGVLHNVGNALNSVTVSTGHLRKIVLEETKVPFLTSVVPMLADNLATAAPDGETLSQRASILEYLGAVTGHLQRVESEVTQELELLDTRVEHIRSVIAFHQNLSRKNTLVTEELNLEDVVEVALGLGESACRSANIEVIRDYGNVGIFATDRHKVIQILLNLVSNARHSMQPLDRPDKVLLVRTRRLDDQHAEIAVCDNGMGIDPEIASRLFQHGFTTRGDGHGFGLHSSANLAGELGGSLGAQSEGVGKGATFVLRLASQAATLTTSAPSTHRDEVSLAKAG